MDAGPGTLLLDKEWAAVLNGAGSPRTRTAGASHVLLPDEGRVTERLLCRQLGIYGIQLQGSDVFVLFTS